MERHEAGASPKEEEKHQSDPEMLGVLGLISALKPEDREKLEQILTEGDG